MLERLRWPHGPVCPHCGVIDDAKRMESREGSETQLRAGVYNCRACRKPFTVTVGTIFEGSHIPLAKWLVGFYLYASSKKSLSALQLQRQLGLGSYRTAWHMAHRIHHAMQNDPRPGKRSGIVEADENHIGGKVRRKAGKPHSRFEGESTARRQAGQKAWQDKRVPVAVLVSRDGKAGARALKKVTGPALREFIAEHADLATSTLHTDEHHGYQSIGREFAGGHHPVNHSQGWTSSASGGRTARSATASAPSWLSIASAACVSTTERPRGKKAKPGSWLVPEPGEREPRKRPPERIRRRGRRASLPSAHAEKEER